MKLIRLSFILIFIIRLEQILMKKYEIKKIIHQKSNDF